MSYHYPDPTSAGKIIPKPAPVDGNRSWQVSTTPAIEPISEQEVKIFGRVDGTSEDELLRGLITSVRGVAELYLKRALIQQSITMVMDYWPTGNILLPSPPIISITSINTIDEDNVKTAYSTDNYYLDIIGGYLVIKRGVVVPSNVNRVQSGFEIIYLAGYGTAKTSVPQGIRDGLKLWVMSAYESRVISNTPPPEAAKMLNPYRKIII